MSFCKNCGILLDDSAKFCPNCGTQVEATVIQTPIYVQPVSQNVVNAKRKTSLAMPILSIVFSSIALLFVFIGGNTYSDFAVEASAALLLVFSVLSTSFGIIGLVKSIKGRRVSGIVISAVSCVLAIPTFIFLVDYTLGNLLKVVWG